MNLRVSYQLHLQSGLPVQCRDHRPFDVVTGIIFRLLIIVHPVSYYMLVILWGP